MWSPRDRWREGGHTGACAQVGWTWQESTWFSLPAAREEAEESAAAELEQAIPVRQQAAVSAPLPSYNQMPLVVLRVPWGHRPEGGWGVLTLHPS